MTGNKQILNDWVNFFHVFIFVVVTTFTCVKTNLESSVFYQVLRVEFLILCCFALPKYMNIVFPQFLILFVLGRSGYFIYDGTTNEAKKDRNYR